MNDKDIQLEESHSLIRIIQRIQRKTELRLKKHRKEQKELVNTGEEIAN